MIKLALAYKAFDTSKVVKYTIDSISLEKEKLMRLEYSLS